MYSWRQKSINLINQDSSSQPRTFSELNRIPIGNESEVYVASRVSVSCSLNGGRVGGHDPVGAGPDSRTGRTQVAPGSAVAASVRQKGS